MRGGNIPGVTSKSATFALWIVDIETQNQMPIILKYFKVLKQVFSYNYFKVCKLFIHS